MQLTFFNLREREVEMEMGEHLFAAAEQQVPGSSEKRLVLTEDVNNGMHNMALL
jgi:hypothetical protein